MYRPRSSRTLWSMKIHQAPTPHPLPYLDAISGHRHLQMCSAWWILKKKFGMVQGVCKECDLNMILECPSCKKKYRLDPSPFSGFKTARVRCRMCGKGFMIVFPATEPAGVPTQPQALNVTHGTPGIAFRSGADTLISPVPPPEPPHRSLIQPAGSWRIPVAAEPDTAILPCPPCTAWAAGDTLSVPSSESPPTHFLQARKAPLRMSRHKGPPSYNWALLVVPMIFFAFGFSLLAFFFLLLNY
jgi:predicted Zn finger-like uncharacterized protein